VDYKVKVALLQSYKNAMASKEASVTKSITRLLADDFGIAVVRSDLTAFRQDEKEFSDWLQREPMHDMTPDEEEAFAAEAREATAKESEPGAEEESDEDKDSDKQEEETKPASSPEKNEESGPTPSDEVPA
jgi:hypothetical protein